jgi:hypothetical protein
MWITSTRDEKGSITVHPPTSGSLDEKKSFLKKKAPGPDSITSEFY